MVFKIVISRLAESEIEETIEFYESRRKGLGKQFLDYFKGYLKILKINPKLISIKSINSIENYCSKNFLL
jgi:hypothetical protein